jgi:next-to-BRCA1 protein 1
MPWPQEVTLMFISKINGDQMGAPEFVPVNAVVMPGEEVDVSVHMVSPSRAGHYQAYFRLCYGPKKFGQRVWIKINVACTSEAENDDEDHVKSGKEVDALISDDLANTPVPPPSFIEGVNDDLADPASPSPSVVDPALLQKLRDLGFTDSHHNTSLLAKHNGNIDAVVDQLLAQQQQQQQLQPTSAADQA